jgi:hypothetical protein
MIRLNIESETGFVQFWARGRPQNAVLMDTRSDEFQTQSTRSAERSVYVELSVNGLVRGFVLSDYPSINDDDENLNLNDVAFVLRIWSESFELVEHLSLTWNAIRGHKTRFERCSLECLEWSGVGAVCSAHSIVQTNRWLSKRVGDVYPRTLLRPQYYISGEMAFFYTLGERLVSETWLTELLAHAMRTLFVGTSISSIEEIQMLLSFMFLSNVPEPRGSLCTIDAMLLSPTSREDVVCRAYHILMYLVFEQWQDAELNVLKKKMVTLGGFPYAALTKRGFVLLLVPYSKIQTVLGMDVPSSVRLAGGEFTAFRSAPIIPITEFSMESQHGLEKLRKGVYAFQQPSAPMGNISHIFGSAHMMLNSHLPPTLVFKIKNMREPWTDQEFIGERSETLAKEMELFNVHRGVVIPLESHPKHATATDEMAYYMTRKPMRVRCMYRIEPSSESFDGVEQELDKAGCEMDIVWSPAATSWILRVGSLTSGYW